MSKPIAKAPEALVTCEVCLKQVPASEATIPEAVDYFVQFCGLDCYAKWQAQAKDAAADPVQTKHEPKP